MPIHDARECLSVCRVGRDEIRRAERSSAEGSAMTDGRGCGPTLACGLITSPTHTCLVMPDGYSVRVPTWSLFRDMHVARASCTALIWLSQCHRRLAVHCVILGGRLDALGVRGDPRGVSGDPDRCADAPPYTRNKQAIERRVSVSVHTSVTVCRLRSALYPGSCGLSCAVVCVDALTLSLIHI